MRSLNVSGLGFIGPVCARDCSGATTARIAVVREGLRLVRYGPTQLLYTGQAGSGRTFKLILERAHPNEFNNHAASVGKERALNRDG